MNIIGISAFNFQDGKLVAAAEEERFSRIKHDARLPVASFSFCLDAGGIALSELGCLAFYENSQEKLARQLWSAIEAPQLRRRLSLDPDNATKEIITKFGYKGPIIQSTHHESHAAAAFFLSGFDRAAVLVCDGVGEWETTTFWRAAKHGIEKLFSVEFPASVGLFYSTITGYLGFNVNGDEYKVMGLAPYGHPVYVDRLRRLLRIKEGGEYELALQYFAFLQGHVMFSDELQLLLGFPPREPSQPVEQEHADLAKSAQVVLEETVLYLARSLQILSKEESLCLTGGVALNCVANRALRESGVFKNVFSQPAAGDSGSCIGATVLANANLTGAPITGDGLNNLFVGPSYTSKSIAEMLDALQVPHEILPVEETAQRAARDLSRGNIIGWFRGRAEFGPRALGGRSILADPRGTGVRDRVNKVIKQRETFRPFAPVVLESRMNKYFRVRAASRFMTETCDVICPQALPAVTHVDNSARIQTVPDDSSHPLFNLLNCFETMTGFSVLLNTSFNLRGEPIVQSSEDALRTFIHSELDALYMENVVIQRSALDMGKLRIPRPQFGEADDEIRTTVYTFF